MHSKPDQPNDTPAAPGEAGGARAELVRKLFEEHNRSLISFLVAKLKSEVEARDVAQEAYVRMLQLDQVGAVTFLRAYLFRIAANLAVDRLRQRNVREHGTPTELFEGLLTRPSLDRTVIAQQELQRVKEALMELPEKCRRAFVLHAFAERSTADIAAAMGVTERMVRIHIARALAHCRATLDEAERSASEGGLS